MIIAYEKSKCLIFVDLNYRKVIKKSKRRLNINADNSPNASTSINTNNK